MNSVDAQLSFIGIEKRKIESKLVFKVLLSVISINLGENRPQMRDFHLKNAIFSY